MLMIQLKGRVNDYICQVETLSEQHYWYYICFLYCYNWYRAAVTAALNRLRNVVLGGNTILSPALEYVS